MDLSPPNSPQLLVGIAEPGPSRLGRGLELLGLFVAVPVLVRWSPLPVPRLAALAVVTAGCLAALLRDPTFDPRRLLSLAGLRQAWPGIAVRAVLVALVVLALVALRAAPAPRAGPPATTWLLGLAAYPLVSVWPQEVVYRAFFFHRYAALMGPRALLAANAVAFGLLHLVYANLLAPLLTVPAGLLLALTYRRSGSMGPVWVEHTLYGMALFALGLGESFGGG